MKDQAAKHHEERNRKHHSQGTTPQKVDRPASISNGFDFRGGLENDERRASAMIVRLVERHRPGSKPTSYRNSAIAASSASFGGRTRSCPNVANGSSVIFSISRNVGLSGFK
jgi:hypothetical protein